MEGFMMHHGVTAVLADLFKHTLEGVLVVEDAAPEDKALVCSRRSRVQSGSDDFLELQYRALSTESQRKQMRGVGGRADGHCQ